MKMKVNAICVAALLMSFCAGAASMFLFIRSQAYKRYGIQLDHNHVLNKYGIHTGKDYSKENPYNYVPVDWLAKEVELTSFKDQFKDRRDAEVVKVITLMDSGRYKLYFYSSPIAMWMTLTGVEGYCVVDTSLGRVPDWRVLTGLITTIN